MRPIEDKVKYVQLRAEGKSYRTIAKEIGISKDTCSKWEAELREEIAERKSEQLQALYESYHMTREARIKQLGDTVKTIDKAIDVIGLDEANPEKLLDLKLKYFTALKDEYLPVNNEASTFIGTNSDYMQNVLVALNDLLLRVRAGEVTTEQATKESAIIANLLKAIEVRDIKHKLEAIESVLEGR